MAFAASVFADEDVDPSREFEGLVLEDGELVEFQGFEQGGTSGSRDRWNGL